MRRILVVDDDAATLDVFARAFHRASVDVYTTGTGAEMLSHLGRESFDAIVMDLRLPDLSGIDLVRTVRQLGYTMPIMIVTGFGTVESAVEAMAAGANQFLQKPLSSHDLVTNVQKLLKASAEPPPTPVAADGLRRWVHAMTAVLNAPHDPTRLSMWAELVGVAPDTLRAWCRSVHLSPKNSLDLARLMRAVRHARKAGCGPEHLLDVAHPRTLRRLFQAAGLSESESIPTEIDLLNTQRFVTSKAAVFALKQSLGATGSE